MKISSVITFLAMIGGITFIMGLMVMEGSLKYDVSINGSNWNSSYNYINQINQSLSPLESDFKKISDTSEESGGWFFKLVSGISAIPKAIIAVPSVVFSSIIYGREMIGSLGMMFLIPGALILIMMVIVFIWGLFKLIEIFQRYPT